MLRQQRFRFEHAPNVAGEIADDGRESIDPLFIKAYWSHKINLRKPNADVFEFLAKDAGILPEETLLVADSENNIQKAAELGFKTKLFMPGEKVEELKYEIF